MKNLILTFAAFLMIGLTATSCSSDDDGGGPQYSVVGKWTVTKYTVNGQEIDECSNNGIRQFKTDGTYLQDDYTIDESGDCVETLDSPLIGSYSQTGHSLRTNIGGLEVNYTLDFLNNNKFMLTETYNNIQFVHTYTRQ